MNPEAIPFARKVLEHLRAHPEEHNQFTFGKQTVCGTQACIAGTAVLLDPESEVIWERGNDDTLQPYIVTDSVLVRDEWGSVNTDIRAMMLLGLTKNQADKLFYNSWNNAQALDLLAEYIAEAEAVVATHGPTVTEMVPTTVQYADPSANRLGTYQVGYLTEKIPVHA